MRWPRLRIIDLMKGVALCAVVLGAMTTSPGESPALAIFLAPTCLATLGARFAGGGRRLFWLGFALFGWVFFAVGLRFGTLYPHELEPKVPIGLLFAVAVGLAASWFAPREGTETGSKG
jgi:hypothetical protein